nr:MAG TPA: hypothetical protein [Inoviridae sp.]
MIDFSLFNSLFDSIKGDLYKFVGILLLLEITATLLRYLKKSAGIRDEKKFYDSLSDDEKKYYDRIKRRSDIRRHARRKR